MELVIVEQRLARAVTPASLQTTLERHAWCRTLYGIQHVRSFIAKDGARMICVFEAPDVEVVRTVARRMGFSYDRIWSALESDGSGQVSPSRTGDGARR